MLINKDVKNTFNSKYCCDRCKKEILNKERYIIYVAKANCNSKKKWDLCKRDYMLLCRGIARGIKKEVDK